MDQYTVIIEARDGLLVPLCAVEGVGHVWPNPDLTLYVKIVGASDPNEATEVAMHEVGEAMRRVVHETRRTDPRALLRAERDEKTTRKYLGL